LKGDAGAAGVAGAQGLPGAVGAAGQNGLKGDIGLSGAQGVAGAAGAQGLKGDTGAAGVAGAQGLQGAVGAAGATGAQGAQGVQGVQGVAGAAGVSLKLIAPLGDAAAAVGQVSSTTFELPASEVTAGGAVAFDTYGTVIVGTATSGRMKVEVFVNTLLVATALQTSSIGATGTTQGYRVHGIVQAASASGTLQVAITSQYGAVSGQSVVSTSPSGPVVIEVRTSIVTASAGMTVQKRVTMLRVL
jgi:Collagen triple helix repeat (20 copies)